jgi:hypothetical protein
MQEPAGYHAEARAVHHIGKPVWPPIESEVQRRGLRLKRVGSELIGGCPKCGGVDRFNVNPVKQVWLCRRCDKAGDVVDLVQHLDDVDFATAKATLIGTEPRRALFVRSAPEIGDDDHARRQHAKAAALWRRRQPILGSIAARYLRARKYLGEMPPTLAFLPPQTPAQHPAMIAAFGSADAPENVEAVHLTLLKADGSGKAEVEKPKLFVGRPLGRPIALAPIGDTLALAITEGIEDGLSVRAALALGVWAAGSAARMPTLAEAVPSFVESVTMAHPDPAGQNGARKLADRLYRRGIEVSVVEPKG